MQRDCDGGGAGACGGKDEAEEGAGGHGGERHDAYARRDAHARHRGQGAGRDDRGIELVPRRAARTYASGEGEGGLVEALAWYGMEHAQSEGTSAA